MGTVIHLSKGRLRAREGAAESGEASGRVALVLGGGGITGAAYHLGVLTAMNAMSETASVNEFDIYVGTSAGSVIAACLANGITPEDLMLANLGHPSASVPAIGADEIMLPDRRGLMRSLVRWPLSFLGALRRYAGHPFTTSLIDGLGALAEGVPQALYTTDGMERYLRDLLDQPGRSNRFDRTTPPAPDHGHRLRHGRAEGVQPSRRWLRPDLGGIGGLDGDPPPLLPA